MNDEVIIDYAKPCMDAEKALKDVHNAVLDNDLDEAMFRAMEALFSVRLVQGALRHMKEQQRD